MDSASVDRSTNGKRKLLDIPDADSPQLRYCGHEDGENFVNVPLRNSDQKFITDKAQERESLGCETPKAKGHLIPETIECPPPPKKPRPARYSLRSKPPAPAPPGGFFVVPRDFHLLFVPYRKALGPVKRSPRIKFPSPGGDRRI